MGKVHQGSLIRGGGAPEEIGVRVDGFWFENLKFREAEDVSASGSGFRF